METEILSTLSEIKVAIYALLAVVTLGVVANWIRAGISIKSVVRDQLDSIFNEEAGNYYDEGKFDELITHCDAGWGQFSHCSVLRFELSSRYGQAALRAKCLHNSDQKSPRQVGFFTGEQTKALDNTPAECMKHKIDSPQGRHIFGQRLGTVEPVLGNIAATPGLDRSTLRGREKGNSQWNLLVILYNLGKAASLAPNFA